LKALQEQERIVTAFGLFSYEFYCSQIPNAKFDWSSAVYDYLTRGAAALLDPHPLFDTKYYVETNNDIDFSSINPLVHFLEEGWKKKRNPHPLVDLHYYSRINTDVGLAHVNPIVHYIHTGASEGRSICPFFDQERYLRTRSKENIENDILCDFITRGAKLGVIPHPIFYRAFALSTSSYPGNHAKFLAIESTPAKTALLEQQKSDFDLIFKNNLFDFEFVRSQLGGDHSTKEQLVEGYMDKWQSDHIDPNLLFDSEFYAKSNSAVLTENVNPFAHFLRDGWKQKRDPHPLFDLECYLTQDTSLQTSGINPLEHFLRAGASERRSTSHFFPVSEYLNEWHKFRIARDAVRYRIQKDNISAYLSENAQGRQYLSAAKVHPLVKNALADFLTFGLANDIYPNEAFKFLFKTDRIEISGKEPSHRVRFRDFKGEAIHAEVYGALASALTNKILNKNQLRTLFDLVKHLKIRNGAKSFLSDGSKSVFFTLHLANRSGAPLLLLRLVKEMSADGWECFVLMDKGGEVKDEFLNYAHVLDMHGLNKRSKHPQRVADARKYLKFIFEDLGLPKPFACILNSIETGAYAQVTHNLGIKNLCLVHEIIHSYPSHFLKESFSNCDKLIFPADFVRDAAVETFGPLTIPHSVLPSALLDENFGSFDRITKRAIFRKEIGVSNEEFVALACASPDMRKGIDLFVSIATEVLARRLSRGITFVWIGTESSYSHSPLYYAKWDIKQAGLEDRVQLLPARKSLEEAFIGSDVFILPSRQDPFPCVVHDAMASQLPVIAFSNAGGMAEMLDGGGYQLAPYGNLTKFADAILFYAENEEICQEHGVANRALVLEKYQFGNYAKRLIENIRELSPVLISPLENAT